MISQRVGTQQDAASMAALEARAVPYAWSEQQYREGLAAGNLALLFHEETALVGLALSLAVLDEAEVLNIAIDPSRQGQGLGTQLLHQLIETLRRQGIRRLYLEVRESNLAARALYQRAGFLQTGQRPNYYRSASGREHAILLEASL